MNQTEHDKTCKCCKLHRKFAEGRKKEGEQRRLAIHRKRKQTMVAINNAMLSGKLTILYYSDGFSQRNIRAKDIFYV